MTVVSYMKEEVDAALAKQRLHIRDFLMRADRKMTLEQIGVAIVRGDFPRPLVVEAMPEPELTSQGPALGHVPTEPGFYWAIGPNDTDEWEVVEVQADCLGGFLIYRDEDVLDMHTKIAWSVRLVAPVDHVAKPTEIEDPQS